MYQIFIRKAWTRDKSYPGGYRPHPGARKTYLHCVDTADEAREFCMANNAKRTRKDQPFYEFTRA